MLYQRYVLTLIQRKVVCSGAGGETFEHAMLGELYLYPTTANLEILINIVIWYHTG